MCWIFILSSFIKELIDSETTTLIIFGSIAVGVSIFIMAVTNTEHAPAAGIALGLVINRWELLTIIFILTAIVWMVGIQVILKKHRMDLISPYEHPIDENKR